MVYGSGVGCRFQVLRFVFKGLWLVSSDWGGLPFLGFRLDGTGLGRLPVRVGISEQEHSFLSQKQRMLHTSCKM